MTGNLNNKPLIWLAAVGQMAALFCSLMIGTSLAKPAAAQTTEPERDSATVIMYHRFGEGRYPSTNISMEQFEDHLALLTNGDYTVLPLPEIVDKLRSGQLLPDRTVAITIDDAYLSVYEKSLAFAETGWTALHHFCCNQPGRPGPERLYELGPAA